MKGTLQLLPLIFLALQDPKIFVDAKRRNFFRGSEGVREPMDDLPFRELPKASANHSHRRLQEDKQKIEKLIADDETNEIPPKGERQGEKNDDKKFTLSPTSAPTSEPTGSPTRAPERTKAPKLVETEAPTSAPTEEPTSFPTRQPVTAAPTSFPTNQPVTAAPTSFPTKPPITAEPTRFPTEQPILAEPTGFPTKQPVTPKPTSLPTKQPVAAPTMTPTIRTTTDKPSPQFILTPSITLVPTPGTIIRSISPTKAPVPDTVAPVDDPTEFPTSPPVSKPSMSPTKPPVTVSKSTPSPTSGLQASASKPPSNPVSDNTMAPTIGSTEAPTMLVTDFEFDETKFIDAVKLKPITFHITVSKFTQIINEKNLELYFKDFIEDVLDMESNKDWYPFNVKSIDNVTIALHPTSVLEGDPRAPSQSRDNFNFPVQLIVNGFVFVNLYGQQNEETTGVNDNESPSSFHDFFEHRLLLYFTFWGVDSLQKILKQEGGLQNPFIDSVSVDEKELISFDNDGNYLHDANDGSSDSIATATPNAESKSSAKQPSKFLLSFVLISSAILWFI